MYVDAERIVAELIGDGGGTRKQTFSLKDGKHSYVKVGDKFKGGSSIIAGTPAKLANIAAFKSRQYDPLAGLQEKDDALDRYAAVKAIPCRLELKAQAVPALEALLQNESEPRVALEAAGSAAKLGSAFGEERIVQAVSGGSLPFLPMEAVFILTELKTPFAKQQLVELATNENLQGDERRQAAIWGLGKAGLKAYEEIVPLIADDNENVAMHAIVSFGHDVLKKVLDLLVQQLVRGDSRHAAAASEALRLSASEVSVRLLIEAARANSTWALATLGRLPPQLVKPLTDGTDLEPKLAPMLLLSEGAHWLSSEDRVLDIAFLAKQNLY